MLTATALPSTFTAKPAKLDACISLSPTEARLEVSRLVANQLISQADAMSQEILRMYPSNEEALVTRILVCEVMFQWQESASLLRKLLDFQGHQAPAESWLHYVRVLNCMGDSVAAGQACREALVLHCDHFGLTQELQRLLAAPALDTDVSEVGDK